jgi:hypothetical protein
VLFAPTSHHVGCNPLRQPWKKRVPNSQKSSGNGTIRSHFQSERQAEHMKKGLAVPAYRSNQKQAESERLLLAIRCAASLSCVTIACLYKEKQTSCRTPGPPFCVRLPRQLWPTRSGPRRSSARGLISSPLR